MKVKIKIPTDWSDVNIETFQKFEELQALELPSNQKNLEIVSLLCSVEKSVLERFKIAEINEIASEINELNVDNVVDVEIKTMIKLNKVKYGLIPNLSEMTTGEFIDLESFIQDGVVKNLHTIMSILYRPIIGSINANGQYTIEDYIPSEAKEQNMLKLPMDIALGVVSFFFRLGLTLQSDLNSSSEKQSLVMARA
tara:strand:+ start:37 stop:624 length:588 start_codon:yes stop_codon:yes gene_type:complete